MDWSTWVAFTVMETVLIVTPGPAVLFTISEGIRGGLRASIAAAVRPLDAPRQRRPPDRRRSRPDTELKPRSPARRARSAMMRLVFPRPRVFRARAPLARRARLAALAVLSLVALLFASVAKYPFRVERDAHRLHYWNLTGVYTKAAHRNPCGNQLLTVLCFDVVVPFVSEYRLVMGADRRTYRVLGYDWTYMVSDGDGKNSFVPSYAVDARSFFYNDNLVPGARPDEIEVGDGFARDKQRIYARGGVETVHDPATFARVTPSDPGGRAGLIKSRAGVSAEGYPPFALVDPETFRISTQWLVPSTGVPEAPGVVHHCSYQPAEDKNFEYRFGRFYRRTWAKKPASPLEVAWIGCRYAVVAGNVYHDLSPVKDADAATFSVPVCSEQPDDCVVRWYAKDRSRVYYGGKPVPGAEPSSLTVFVARKANANTAVFAFDAHAAYCDGRPCADWNDGGRSLARFEAARKEWRSSPDTR